MADHMYERELGIRESVIAALPGAAIAVALRSEAAAALEQAGGV